MTEKEANKLRKIFEESEIFQYYEHYGARAVVYADTGARMKYSQGRKMGLKGGVTRGKQWKKMIEDKDPRIKAHYQNMNLKSQEYFSKNPEAKKLRSEAQTIGFNKFIQDLKDSGEYDAWKKISTDKFSKWAKDNPDIILRTVTAAGYASLEKRRQDPVAHKKQCSDNGKKGMASLQKLYKENPELKAKNHKIACDAANIVNIEKNRIRREESIKKFMEVLPMRFDRAKVKELKHKHNLAWVSIDKILKDPTLISKEMFRPIGLKGKGGTILMYNRLF